MHTAYDWLYILYYRYSMSREGHILTYGIGASHYGAYAEESKTG